MRKVNLGIALATYIATDSDFVECFKQIVGKFCQHSFNEIVNSTVLNIVELEDSYKLAHNEIGVSWKKVDNVKYDMDMAYDYFEGLVQELAEK